MKYTETIEIDLPRERVVELFEDTDRMKEWQPDMISFEHLEGEPGQKGAKSKLRYKMGKREIEMIEEIVERDLPDTFSATYETKGVWNQVDNRFEEVDGRTRWIATSDFRFNGFMKVIGFFFKGAFPKETRKFMNQFKDWAEKQGRQESGTSTGD